VGGRIVGLGSHLPRFLLTNADLERMVETSDEWIVQRTGIRERHHLQDGEDPAVMAIEAGRAALARADTSPGDVDLLLVATTFPDMICPGSAPFIAGGLGLGDAPFLDLKAGCSGFVYGLALCDALLRCGHPHRILLIGTEALSRVIDWNDRKTCVLFGDGAGAALLESGDEGEGILGSALFGDADKAHLLRIPAGGTRTPTTEDTVAANLHYLKMEGAGVYRSAVAMMESSSRAALTVAGISLGDVDWVVPHQANIRIIESLIRRLGVRRERVVINLDRVANTSAASIPIALDEATRDGRILPGHIVLMTAFGAGATYGAVVMRMDA